VFESRDLPITKYVWFYDNEYNEDDDKIITKIEKEIKYPVVVKPATLGSSVGISSCKNREELVKAINDAIQYDEKIVVEEKVENLTEVNISVLGNHENINLSVLEEVTTDDELLTFDDKYISGSKKGASKGMASAARKVPADIPKKLEEEVRRVASEAFKACNLSGDVRIDFLIDQKKNNVYINEINSCPGSLAFYLWEPTGKEFTKLLDEMISIAIKDYKNRSNKTHTFKSNILSGYSGLKGVKGLKGKLR
jgi:D-alanine-D-alanine ligase